MKYTDGDKRSELLQTYASLRNQLITSSKILRYDFEKLEYLRSLNTKLEETFDTKIVLRTQQVATTTVPSPMTTYRRKSTGLGYLLKELHISSA